jgi:hypothetical protein
LYALFVVCLYYDYFKNLNTNIDNDNNNIDIDINIDNLSPEMEEILNSPITADEIKSVVQKLKIGKSAGSSPKILSTVENPLLNPACASEISSTSSANLFNLLLRTAVNVLLRHSLAIRIVAKTTKIKYTG